MKIYFLVIIGIFLTLGSNAQQQAYQINYTILLSEEVKETLTNKETLTDPNIQLLQAISSGFDADNPVLEVWSNKDYFKIKTHLFEPLTQITDRTKQQTFHLFDEDSTYVLEELQTSASTWKGSIEHIPGKTKEIAGYQTKLAELTISEQEKLQIWYTPEIPPFSWGDYAYLNDIPGAALQIGADGINFQAVKISKQNNLATDFFAAPKGYQQITEAQYTDQRQADYAGESLNTDSVEEHLSEGMLAYFDKESNLYGLKTEAGDLVSEPEFTTLSSFLGGQAIAYSTDYLAGVIDKKGQHIIPFEYTYLVYEPAWESYIYAKDDFMGLINRKGEINPDHRYTNLSNLSDGYAMYAVNDKHGLLNKQLKIVVPAAYDYILQYNHKYFIISEDSTSKIMSIDNQQVVLEGFKELYLAGEDNLFIASNDGVLYGYVGATGETIIPFKYSYASPFSDGLALVALQDSEEFITINTKGEIIEQPAE